MADINVVRCKMTITRRGGWSWGEHPRSIAQRVSHVLPELILQRIGEQFETDSDVEIRDPVVIRLRLSKSDLLQLHSRTSLSWGSTVNQQIEDAVRQSSFERQFAASVDRTSTTTSPDRILIDPMKTTSTSERLPTSLNHTIFTIEDAAHGVGQSWILDLFEWLAEYAKAQRLPFLFSQLTPQTIAAWHDAIFHAALASTNSPQSAIIGLHLERSKTKNDVDPNTDGRGQPTKIETHADEKRIPDSLVAQFDQLETWLPRVLDQKGIHSYRLHAALLAYRERKDYAFDRNVLGAIARRIPLDEAKLESLKTNSSDTKSSDMCSTSSDPQTKVTSTSLRSTSSNGVAWSSQRKLDFHGEFTLDSVLPFLLLEPLSRAGYWRTMSLALHTAGLPEFAASFAMAFAFKLMQAPQRGWMRTSQDLRAAQAFACMQDLATEELVRLANQAEAFSPLLDTHLANQLLADLQEHHPFFLTRLSSAPTDNLLLFDAAGAFPIAILQDTTDLEPILQGLNNPCLLIGERCSDDGLLSDLDSLGLTFVLQTLTASSPNRRRVRHRDGRTFWTNSFATKDGQILKWGAKIEATEANSELFAKDVAVDRLGTPRNCDRGLEHSLILAAGVGLAQIAWDLWKDKEDTHPMLALERFGDLSGKVRISDDEVRVTLPLGRRSMDLQSSGFLDDQCQIPWLSGRTLRFERG